MPWTVQPNRVDQHGVVLLRIEYDPATIPKQLQLDELTQCLACAHIAEVQVANTNEYDTPLIQLLLAIHKFCANTGIELSLRHASPELVNLIKLLGLANLLSALPCSIKEQAVS